MIHIITIFIQLLEGRFGVIPAGIGVLALVLVFLSLVLFAKLRSAREKIHQLAKHLGYEPPYGDGTEVLYEEFRKDIALRGKEEQIKQLELQLEELEVKEERSEATLNALQMHAKVLEDQLQLASDRNSELAAQAREEAEARVAAAELMEMRILNLEAEKNDSVNALEQRAKALEEQLQQAAVLNNEITAQADEQAQAHRITVEQMEESIRSMEAERCASVAALDQRAQELEEQLQQTSLRNNEMTAQAGEQAQAHRATVEQLELRMRDMEAESGASLTALQQQARELEQQLEQASLRSTSDASIAQQEALERHATIERFKLQVRDLESENNARESRLNALQAQVKDLEDQLRQAADRSTVQNRQAAPDASKPLLRRAEWLTACAVGAVRTLGLVAAEAYAAAAVAADSQDRDAQQLLVELTKLRSASRGSFPSVAEAVTTFDERSADFFGADLAGAAHLAEREALDRYQRGLNRTALLVTNFGLALHKQLSPQNLADTRSLQEMRAALLARLGSNATRPAAS